MDIRRITGDLLTLSARMLGARLWCCLQTRHGKVEAPGQDEPRRGKVLPLIVGSLNRVMRRGCFNVWPVLAIALTFSGSQLHAQFAYVANSIGNISGYAVSPATGVLTALADSPFPAGNSPLVVAVDPSGKFAYVVNDGDKSVSGYAIDPITGGLTGIAGSPFPAGIAPFSVALDPKGRFAYVVNAGNNTVSGYTIDPANGTLTAIAGSPFPTRYAPIAMEVDPSGTFAYLANNDQTLSTKATISGYAIDPATGALTEVAGSPFVAGKSAYALALDASGKFVYVVDFNLGDVLGFAIDRSTGSLTAIPGSPFPAGNVPLSIAMDPNGMFAYVVNDGDDTVSGYTIDSTTGALAAIAGSPFASGLEPNFVAVAPSGKFAYVVNNFDSSVSGYSIDPATGGLTAIAGSPFPAGAGASSIAVTRAVLVPVANAGLNQTAEVGTLVSLDGSASSDPSGQLPLSYAWSFASQPAGSAATLSNPSIVNPAFNPDAVGNYILQLIVTDAAGLSSTPVSVTISTSDPPPVAQAGPDQQITVLGMLVQLSGAGSYDPAGLPLSYQWSFLSKPGGSNAALTGFNTPNPSFVADLFGSYSIQLIVTDSLGTTSSASDTTVSFNDVAPIANAGPSQSATVGQTIPLNGNKSTDTDAEPLTYNWSMVSTPSGSKSAISNPTSQTASFVPDLPGAFVVQLTVNDGILSSAPATAEIVAVSSQTQSTLSIHNLQNAIKTLPESAFRNAGLKNALLIELNAVLLSVTAHDYNVGLQLLQKLILPQTKGCATSGSPDKTDWIINCAAQSIVYTPLLNIIAEVRSLIPAPTPTQPLKRK